MAFLLTRAARRHGWQVTRATDDGRAAFREQERRRRKEAWRLLRQGRVMEGYRTGVFGATHSGPWHMELTVTGTWRGHPFTATQSRRYELRTTSDGPRRRTRRRATVTLAGKTQALGTRLRSGRLLTALADLSADPMRNPPPDRQS